MNNNDKWKREDVGNGNIKGRRKDLEEKPDGGVIGDEVGYCVEGDFRRHVVRFVVRHLAVLTAQVSAYHTEI